MNELVSVITPCYNSEKYIEQTINSVLNQSYTNWEMLIVDDFSNDLSVSVIEKYQTLDKRIKLIKLTQNSGAAVARNKGIEKAKGAFIAFLDSDDMWLPNKLEKQLYFMITNNYYLTYTSYQRIDEQSNLGSIVNVLEKLSYNDMLSSNKIGCLTAMYNVKELGKIFFPIIRKRQDYALWLSILKKIPYAHGLNDVLAFYRLRKGSISNNKIKLLKYNWYLFYRIEKLPFFKATFYLIKNIFKKILG